MFYSKTKKGEKVCLTPENIFTTCPGCGAEVPVDLAAPWLEAEELWTIKGIFCECCSPAAIVAIED